MPSVSCSTWPSGLCPHKYINGLLTLLYSFPAADVNKRLAFKTSIKSMTHQRLLLHAA